MSQVSAPDLNSVLVVMCAWQCGHCIDTGTLCSGMVEMTIAVGWM